MRTEIQSPFHNLTYVLRALLPELITFGYIPSEERRIVQAESSQKSGKPRERERSPDYSAFLTSQSHQSGNLESEEHVLILEFIQTGKGKKGKNPSVSSSFKSTSYFSLTSLL